MAKGWFKDHRRHVLAGKGRKTTGNKSSKGSGWFNDSDQHAQAAKGEEVKSEGIIDGLTE